jgi:hypothetical protein
MSGFPLPENICLPQCPDLEDLTILAAGIGVLREMQGWPGGIAATARAAHRAAGRRLRGGRRRRYDMSTII